MTRSNGIYEDTVHSKRKRAGYIQDAGRLKTRRSSNFSTCNATTASPTHIVMPFQMHSARSQGFLYWPMTGRSYRYLNNPGLFSNVFA